MHSHGIALLIFASLPSAAHSEGWKTEIDNSLVTVSRRVLASHETISVADPAPALFVLLTDHGVRIATAVRREEIQGMRGHGFWHGGGNISLENPGEQRVELVRVVPKFRPDPSYQLRPAKARDAKFENELIRMRHIGPRSPGASGPPPDRLMHPASSVMIELTEAHLRLRHISGRMEAVDRKAGDIWFQPEDPFYEESAGEPEHEVLRIELKNRELQP